MKYNKLVGDKIPDIIKQKGGAAMTHAADGKEYWEKLKEKLLEEVGEFMKEPNEEELADILEVIYAVCDFKGFDRDSLEKLRMEKAERRGGFKKRIVLEES